MSYLMFHFIRCHALYYFCPFFFFLCVIMFPPFSSPKLPDSVYCLFFSQELDTICQPGLQRRTPPPPPSHSRRCLEVFHVLGTSFPISLPPSPLPPSPYARQLTFLADGRISTMQHSINGIQSALTALFILPV